LVQGLSIEWLVRWLGLDALLVADRLACLEGDFAAKQSAMNRLPALLASGLFSSAIAMRLQGHYAKQLDRIKAAIEELHSTALMDDDTQRALLSLRGLAEEKSLYVEMFNKGHLSERAFRRLLLALQQQMDAVRGRGASPYVPPARVSRHRLEEAVLRLVNRVTALAPLAARLHWQRIVLDYEIARARAEQSTRTRRARDVGSGRSHTPLHCRDGALPVSTHVRDGAAHRGSDCRALSRLDQRDARTARAATALRRRGGRRRAAS
jgi:CPA1 family monovalent cation:H+ antiporter